MIFIDENTKLKEPWCSTKEILQELSLPAIDQLRSIVQRSNLSMQGRLLHYGLIERPVPGQK